MAVKRVTENRGKRTPGIDQETWRTPLQKTKATKTIRQGHYRAQPLRRILIPKANGGKRPLGIPTMKDRAKQALHLLALDPIAECTADAHSYGFRRGRSSADAIEYCFHLLSRRKSPRWVLEGDIEACFDKISHQWLLENIPMEKGILAQWLKAGYIDHNTLFKSEAGTPQGGIVSPVLANMALDGLEKLLKTRFKYRKVNIARYADDFIITGESKELLAEEIQPVVKRFLSERGLTLSVEKTRITPIEEGVEFLGQTMRKFKDKLMIKPSKKSINRFIGRIREILKQNKEAKVRNLIGLLNPLIRGWTNYHRHVVSGEVFSKVDAIIWNMLWTWAKRRHPKKSRWWILDNYFKPYKGYNRTFTGKLEDGRYIYIQRPCMVPIQRHRQIRASANPYDPKDGSYFKSRLALEWQQGCHAMGDVRKLWKIQKGQCSECKALITNETGWNIHHHTPKAEGGTDNLDNLRLLHPICHQKHHAKGFSQTTGSYVKDLKRA
jgi:RNA-directed DNA polymerase